MGIDYTRRPATPPAAPPAAPAAPATAAAAPTPPGGAAAPAVSLSKVTLTKSAPSVSLTKHGGNRGLLRVNLNWDAKPPAKGLFRKNTLLDLDLGCLYEFTDGSKGVVQALGNAFRARPRNSNQDLIWLDGDDRSGTVQTGENLFINLEGLPEIKRILVFALIYEGAANWAAANGVTTISPLNAPPIEIRLDDPRDGARICAIALLTNERGELTIRREVNYLNGAQRKLDEAYGWGMNWTAGRK
ncbi:MAG: tellurite resistance protein TerA [Pseudonocardiales bacterium]|jgi:tellurite resistance protein TerA|nr:tellurium resistance protein [Jatrophihabitans sp.]MDT4903798.1 tellurite resistance protein TerA [Pseudonocardiales bacterium]MDT4929460.1 tellurite resistance protein TerA [Pseudonocardiales bacterium]MDT4951071.1 tellurite resistance protein TerA [Pseudonocardiales bacterium]